MALNTTDILDAMHHEIVARGCFVVGVKVSKENEVTLTIESETSTVDLEDCVAISRAFEQKFDRENEDYALTVSSAGLDQPFKVLKQYQKAVGSKVEVMIKGGKKFIALLKEATEDGITLSYTALEVVEGKKKKEKVDHLDFFPYSTLTSVRPYVEFE